MKRQIKGIMITILVVSLVIPIINLPQPILSQAQESTPSNSPSTIWQEYDYIPPKLIINNDNYTYQTTWGNYTFLKTLPFVMKYTFRDKSELISYSTFWVKASKTFAPSNAQILIANDTYYKVQVSLVYLKNTQLKTAGYLTQEWNFNRPDKPKVTVTLTKTSNWSSDSLGDFNIWWGLVALQYIKQSEGNTIDCKVSGSYYFKNDTKAELGYNTNPSSWSKWLIIDWNDEGIAQVYYGSIAFPSGSLSGLMVVFNVNDNKIDPSTVGTSTTSDATLYSYQRKSFYANGRYWVFYSDGTNMVYRTSTDGSTWSSATAIRACAYGVYFSIWFDGTYLHYACAPSGNIYYRRGTPNSDGTITWSAVEQTISAYGARYAAVATDSSGYVWIGYQAHDSATSTVYYPYVIKSGNNDGTWGTTPSGFPYQLNTLYDSDAWVVSVIPLTVGKMLVLYASGSASTPKVYAKSWSGSAWGTEVSTVSSIGGSSRFSAVAQGDDVYLVFLKASTYDIIYTKYTYSTNSFSAGITVQSATNSDVGPALSIDTTTNNLYCFWAGSPTANHIYYKKCVSGTWDTAATDWITETATLTNNRLTCFYQSWNSKIGLVYMTATASPYNVRFDYLNLNTAPTIGSFQAPSTIYAYQTALLNATVNDADGRANLKNTTLSLSVGSIKLSWIESTNATSIIDPSNYAELVSSTISAVNSTAYKITWSVKFYWNYTEGYVSLDTNTKVFDDAVASGSSTVTNWFYFEDDLIVSSASVNDSRINPSQSITFNGQLYYEGTTIAPYTTSGITAKVELNGVLKSSSSINSDGSFTLPSFSGESVVGSYNYNIYATTDQNTVTNQTVAVIVDRLQVQSYTVSDSRADINTNANIDALIWFDYDNTVCTTATITINGYSATHIGNGVYRITRTSTTVTSVTYNTVACSSESTYGITTVDQNNQSATVIWDRFEFVSITANDTRINVGGAFELRYQIRYDYDDVVFDSTKGSIDGFTWDSVNLWWDKTVTGSSSVASTNYDETYITISDTTYGITVKQDVAGINVVTDRIIVNYKGVDDSRINVNSNGEVRFKLRSEYDNSFITSGSVSINGSLATWDATNSWWKLTVTQSSVGSWNYIVSAVNWDVYGITALNSGVATNSTSIIWDRGQVQSYTVSDSRTNINDNVNIDVLLYYDYDNTPITDGTVTINGYSATHQGSGVWRITGARSSVGSETYNTVAISGNTYGITQIDQNSKSATVIWDQMNAPTVTFNGFNSAGQPSFTVTTTYAYDNALASGYFRWELQGGSVIEYLQYGTRYLTVPSGYEFDGIIIRPVNGTEYGITSTAGYKLYNLVAYPIGDNVIKICSSNNATITNLSWDSLNHKLSFTTTASSTYPAYIWVGSLGKPISISMDNSEKSEGQGWSWDNTNKVVVLTGSTNYIISWGSVGGGESVGGGSSGGGYYPPSPPSTQPETIPSAPSVPEVVGVSGSPLLGYGLIIIVGVVIVGVVYKEVEQRRDVQKLWKGAIKRAPIKWEKPKKKDVSKEWKKLK